MKTLTQRILRHTMVAMILTSSAAAIAQDANWIGGSGEWNNGANWDVLVAPGPLTNAFINSNLLSAVVAVTYDTPMVEASVGTVRVIGETLAVNAGGFAVDGVGNDAVFISGPTAALVVNNGGVVNVAGGLTLSNITATTVNVGGTLNVMGTIFAGAGTGNGGDKAGVLTNWGGTINAAGLAVSPNGANANSRVAIRGGVNNLGAVVIKRSNITSAGSFGNPGNEGLLIYDGLVNMTSLDVGGGAQGNSFLTMFMANGAVTNTGTFTLSQISANRASRFLQTNGTFVSLGDSVHLRGQPVNNAIVIYSVTGGTNLVPGFVFSDAGDIAGRVFLTNTAKIYVGSGGFTMGGSLSASGTNVVLNSGGTFGARADWTGTVPMILTGGTLDAADLDGTPHNITLSGSLSGSGALIKTGGGILTLDAANSYSGNTLISVGTLALGANGSVSTSPQIVLASNTVFDVSAVSGGFVLNDSRTIAGFGVITGAVSMASGAIANPGSPGQPGSLTFTNDLIATNGGAVFHFDLSNNPLGNSNDFVSVGGDLTVSNLNAVEISGTVAAGSAYPLIHYGGNLNGYVTNLTAGASGTLSNNATTRTIYLVAQSAVRSPTIVSWVGNANVLSNIWNTLGRTNWLNAGTLDYFVLGDTARFDSIGASHPLVYIIETVLPGSVTVDSTTSYTFTGAGRIGGAASLTKTNSGTLTILTTNSYTGPTTIGGGVLEAPLLGDGAANSSIGASSSTADNLVFTGGTLKYPGDTVGINRGATFNGTGTIEVSNSATVLTIIGTLAGPGVMAKTGAGTLTLAAANSYSGGTIISEGILRLDSASGAGTGGITNNGATLLISDALTVANPEHFNGTCTIDLNNVSGNIAVDGAWSGSGTVNIINQLDNTRVFTIGGSMSNFSGTISLGANPGTLRFNDGGGLGSGPNFGSAAATFDLGTSTGILRQRNGGTSNELGALIGGPSTQVIGYQNNAGLVAWMIGGNNLSTVFEGTIVNGGTANSTTVTKVGAGKLTLTGASTYDGPTTVSNGTLQVDGSLGFTVVTVEGGTLSGIGTIGGPVTVNSAGTLAPGDSVGTLTLSSDLTIAGNLAIDVDKSLSPSNDVMTVSGVLSASSGTITVQNLGPALQVGDTFVLFNQSVTGGSALTVTGAGATWNNNLELDGSISVASVGAAQPTIGTITSSGGSVIINGSNGPATGNYIVLATTNVAAAVGTWTPILTNPFNGDGTFSVTNAIVPGTPRLFYLIQVQ